MTDHNSLFSENSEDEERTYTTKHGTTLLNDEEWSGWTQTRISDQCGVSQQFVSKIAKENHDLTYNNSKSKTGKDGRTIDTSRIGKPKFTPEKHLHSIDFNCNRVSGGRNRVYVNINGVSAYIKGFNVNIKPGFA